MGKSVGTDQSHAIMAALATNVDWTQLDGGLLQEQVVKNATEAGAHFTAFLKNGARVVGSWREQDGVIRFSVTSDATGEDWIKRLEGNSFRVGDYTKQVLRSSDFKPTSGVTTEIAVLKGMLFEDRNRVTKNIRAEAERRHLTKPNAEVACLIREKFTDKEIEAMGLIWIIVMHEPIMDSVGDPRLLGVHRYDGGRWLNAYHAYPDHRWNRGSGFAFAASQVSA